MAHQLSLVGRKKESAPTKPSVLVIDVAKVHNNAPIVRLEVNGIPHDINVASLKNKKQLRFAIPVGQLKQGSIILRLHSYKGDWLEFDAVSLESEDKNLKLAAPRGFAAQQLRMAGKDRLIQKQLTQALVIDVINRQQQNQTLDIWVDGKKLESHDFIKGRQS